MNLATVGIAFLGIGISNRNSYRNSSRSYYFTYFGIKCHHYQKQLIWLQLFMKIKKFLFIYHIKYMMYTTIPSFLITLIIFLIIGLNFETNISSHQIDEALNIISNKFEINLWLFLVPISVIILIIFVVIYNCKIIICECVYLKRICNYLFNKIFYLRFLI